MNEGGKVPLLTEPTNGGEVGAQDGQLCSHMLGLDSEILPGKNDPSANISRVKSGKSIPAEGIACDKTLRWVEE